jgi:hypothetical protein
MEQKINENFKHSLKIGLCILSIIGLIFSLIFLVFIFNVKTNPEYLFFLSKKIRADYFYKTEIRYNKQFNQSKKFGEFCYRLIGDEIDKNKVNLTLDQQKIRGSLYYNDQVFVANINPVNLDLEFNRDEKNFKWKWYNWLGFGF